MTNPSLIESEQFWKVVNHLLSLNEKASTPQIMKNLNISYEDLLSYSLFLKSLNIETHIDQEYIWVNTNQLPTIRIDFNLLQWLALQAHFPAISGESNKPYHHFLADKLSEVEYHFSQLDLFKSTQTLQAQLDSKSQVVHLKLSSAKELLTFIEECVLEGVALEIKVTDKLVRCFPRQIVFLEGSLKLIGEDMDDKCLTTIDIDQIDQCYEEQNQWKPVYSAIEVEDFIASIKAISDQEVRLVLKIHSMDSFEVNVKYQHLGSPCLVTNPKGEYIWAASIEPSPSIFEWVESLGSKVEILDPQSFKLSYLEYCESKLKKIA